MANFRTRVDDLTAFTTTDDTALADWLAEGCKVIINEMPQSMLVEVSNESSAFAPTTGLETGKVILGVTRMTAASNGITYQCRPISMNIRNEAQDENHILYATETDPVYFIESQSSGNPFVKILPISSLNLAKVTSVEYPTPAVTDSAITRFPNKYEYLVVLYAAVKAVEQLLATEEDVDLYIPMLKNLKQDYATGLVELKPQQPQVQARAQARR